MRKNIPPILAVLGGLVGFGLRKWQLATGFEADTGLAIPGTPASIALILWSVLVALALIALNWNQKERLDLEHTFAAARQNTLFVTAGLLSALLLLGSGGVEIVLYSVSRTTVLVSEGQNQMSRMATLALPPLRILLCLGGLPAVFLWIRSLYRGGEKSKESLCLLELCLLFCVWLISDYQTRAADPVILDYVYEVFAIIAGLLGIYYVTGYSFQNGRPRRALFFCLLGTYLSLVTMADQHSLADLLRYGFAVLFLTAHAVLILYHPSPEDAPAEDHNTEADENA
jgi:hypothetical protein